MSVSYKWVFLLLILAGACQNPEQSSAPKQEDPLSLWNETEVKNAIIDFVINVTDPNASTFVAEKDRIAVFDNDGTLWIEKPLYIPVKLELAYIQKEYANRPEWKDDPFFTGIYNSDFSVLEGQGTIELIQKLFGAHAGQKEEVYKSFVYETLSNVNHSRFDRPLKELTYSPMVELVHYLQKNDFKVFIVTGGEITSVRTVSEEIYNIPKEMVVGSSVEYKYVSNESGAFLVRQEKISSANDKHIKPTNIELHIGKQPIFAAGNSDGDYEMMEYTLSAQGLSMAILVHHDDEEREYTYMHGTEKAIEDAEEKGWYVISMKNDFKEIFAE